VVERGNGAERIAGRRRAARLQQFSAMNKFKKKALGVIKSVRHSLFSSKVIDDAES